MPIHEGQDPFPGTHHLKPRTTSRPQKVSAVRDMPKPTTTKEVRRFIGMAGYYRRFIERFADICAPLHALVNNKWSEATHPQDWTKECDTAFATLKSKLVEAPVLRLVSLDLPLVLRTDASKIAMGATLYNDVNGVLHPIEYRSKKFSEAQQKKAPHEQEFIAVLYGLAEFRCYLLGRPFTLETDNSAVSWIKTSKTYARSTVGGSTSSRSISALSNTGQGCACTLRIHSPA